MVWICGQIACVQFFARTAPADLVKPEGAVAVTCCPPIRIKFVLKELEKPQDAASKRRQDA